MKEKKTHNTKKESEESLRRDDETPVRVIDPADPLHSAIDSMSKKQRIALIRALRGDESKKD